MKKGANRILIVVENLPVPFDRRVWQESLALAEAGFGVTVICPTGRGYESRYEVIDGIEILRYPLPLEARSASGYLLEYGCALWWQSFLALRVFIRSGFRVIHACNPPDLIFLVALPYKFLFGRYFVFDHHDLCPELAEAKFGKKKLVLFLMRAFERLTFLLANRSIATNESYKRIAIERGRMAPENIVVVRSGPDLARFKPQPPDPEIRTGAKYFVGYIGVMGKQEGLQYLLLAVQYLIKERNRTDIKFILIGSGPELGHLKEQSKMLGVERFVEFTGRVPDDELIRSICSCDLCVNPDEANPMNDLSTMNKVLEYMALEKPIVQFDLKEGRESAGEASLYAKRNDPVDLADRILELLDDPERRAAMGAAGRKRIEESLGWIHQKRKLVWLYNDLLGQN